MLHQNVLYSFSDLEEQLAHITETCSTKRAPQNSRWAGGCTTLNALGFAPSILLLGRSGVVHQRKIIQILLLSFLPPSFSFSLVGSLLLLILKK